MRIEYLCKEKKLWEGGAVPEAARKRRKRGGCGADILHSGNFAAAQSYFVRFACTAVSVACVFLLKAHNASADAEKTKYCISKKGVYVQIEGSHGAVTEFKSFQDIHTIRTEPGEIGTGHLICEYGKPHPSVPYAIRLEDLPDCQQVFRRCLRKKASWNCRRSSSGMRSSLRMIPVSFSRAAFERLSA